MSCSRTHRRALPPGEGTSVNAGPRCRERLARALPRGDSSHAGARGNVAGGRLPTRDSPAPAGEDGRRRDGRTRVIVSVSRGTGRRPRSPRAAPPARRACALRCRRTGGRSRAYATSRWHSTDFRGGIPHQVHPARRYDSLRRARKQPAPAAACADPQGTLQCNNSHGLLRQCDMRTRVMVPSPGCRKERARHNLPVRASISSAPCPRGVFPTFIRPEMDVKSMRHLRNIARVERMATRHSVVR